MRNKLVVDRRVITKALATGLCTVLSLPLALSPARSQGASIGASDQSAATATAPPPAQSSPAGVTTPSVTAGKVDDAAQKMLVKPGQAIHLDMATDDLQPTDDPDLARRQAEAYPDSPEAAFLLAVALTRTSRVEEAYKQVRHAKQLAQSKGGPEYFDKMIASYEEMLLSCPDDNRVRYTLAWAYYMKAYLLSKAPVTVQPASAPPTVATEAGTTTTTSAATTTTTAVAATPPEATKKNARRESKAKPDVDISMAGQVLSMISPQLAQNLPAQGLTTASLPHLPVALEQAPPSAVPQVKKYYELALKNLDDLLARKPDDIWARVYRAHLAAEYTGNLSSAMDTWRDCRDKNPQNPAPYLFLGEGYLKEGNLKECLSNVSRAIALRAIGN